MPWLNYDGHSVQFHGPFRLDRLDELSIFLRMEEITALTKEIEGRARELGANPAAIAKWRKRGIPARWQLKLLGAYGDIQPKDLAAPFEATAGQ